jgi:hypothetical protein
VRREALHLGMFVLNYKNLRLQEQKKELVRYQKEKIVGIWKRE